MSKVASILLEISDNFYSLNHSWLSSSQNSQRRGSTKQQQQQWHYQDLQF